jgi:hypothetical protein
VAACKALRDAMQAPRVVRGRRVAGASIVVDDSAKWSAWTYAQERAADGEQCERGGSVLRGRAHPQRDKHGKDGR